MTLIPFHELTTSDKPDPQVYNGGDVCGTHEICSKILQLDIPKDIYAFERALQGPVLEMMLRGWLVDPFLREKGIRETREKLHKLSLVIDTYAEAGWDEIPGPSKTKTYPCPKRLNPESTEQLQRFFYNNLGLKPIVTRKKGITAYPMDRKTLEKLQIQSLSAKAVISAILNYRDWAGQLEVLENAINDDWRMRTSYNIGGTKNYRFSSSESTDGTGGNLQNITPDLRHMFIADPGYKIYAFDKEQAESRQVGFICGILFKDWSYLDACESGDLHTYVARLVWPYLNWNGDLKHDRKIADTRNYRHFTFRDTTKRLGHGSNYKGSPWELSEQTHTPLKLVEEFQPIYFDAFPCIPKWHTWIASELQTKRHLFNVFGVRRDFFDRPNDQKTIKSAIAFQPQSATANDLNLGLWRVWHRRKNRVQLLGQLHDAIYFQAREDDDERELVQTIQEDLNVELEFNGRKFVVPTECKAGWSWGNKYKQDENGNLLEVNPRGLDKVRV